MKMRKSDQEILDEYKKEMKIDPNGSPELILKIIKLIREDEPRINSAIHLLDYMNIHDDSTMDEVYGTDYFTE